MKQVPAVDYDLILRAGQELQKARLAFGAAAHEPGRDVEDACCLGRATQAADHGEQGLIQVLIVATSYLDAPGAAEALSYFTGEPEPPCPACGGRGWHTAGGNDPSPCGRCAAGELWYAEALHWPSSPS